MKGLIYKDFHLVLKTADKKMLFIIAGFAIIIYAKLGIYSGLILSIMLSMSLGMQAVMSIAADEQVKFRKYELALPVKKSKIVLSKYVSVLLVLSLSVGVSIVSNIISVFINRRLEWNLIGISLGAAVLLPVVWSAVCLPLTYWFNYQTAQVMSFVTISLYFIL